MPTAVRSRVIPALALAIAGTAALAACSPYGTARGDTARDWITQARVTGPAQSCIPLSAIRETRVRDGRTIDFMTSSRRGWRNVLPGPGDCPGLNRDKAITYSTATSQLCNVDVIHVLEDWGGRLQRGAGCGLGTFTPIELR